MASAVDICNLALARLGDSATVASIDPPEGSAQAEHCARFYPIALKSMLEMHDWKFATRRATLAALDVDTFNWSFAYALPAGLVKILAVLEADASPDSASQDYDTLTGEDGTLMIMTNVENATVLYTASVTDVTKFSPLFVDALSWLLASHLAGPILKGDAGRNEARACMGIFRGVFAAAAASDANQRRVEPTHNPAWIGGR